MDGASVAATGACSGTVAIVLHCGHDARLPAAAAGTFRVRPQPVQGNSIVPAGAAGSEPENVVMIGRASSLKFENDRFPIILSLEARRNWAFSPFRRRQPRRRGSQPHR